MKAARVFIIVLAGLGLLALIGYSQVARSPDNPATMPSATASPSHIDAITSAANPSAAIDAYSQGIAIDPNNIALRKAYVRKMVDFGLPEMAESQATFLTNSAPDDGLAWAVLAYINAKQGQMPASLGDYETAHRLLPNDLFVVRTGGQLFAWLDIYGRQSQIPDNIRQSMEAIRPTLNGLPAYEQAYIQARDYYSSYPSAVSAANQAYPTTQPTAATTESTAPYYYTANSGQYPQMQQYPSYIPSAPDTYTQTPGYYYTNDETPYPYYYPTYPYGYYDNYWWPSFGGGFFFDDGFRHRDFDRDDFFRGRGFEHQSMHSFSPDFRSSGSAFRGGGSVSRGFSGRGGGFHGGGRR